MKVIVNADDFGMSHNKNVAIDFAMRHKLCTQTSVAVNMGFFEEAVEMAQKGNYMDKVSLHLNLTEGNALSEEIKKIPLYYEDGKFVHRPIIKIIKQIMPLHIKPIQYEIEAQIEKFVNCGFELRRLDSHNWVHLRIPVWIALMRVDKKYNICSIRPLWKGYFKKEIAGKWHRYFKLFWKYMKRSSKVQNLSYSSNIEQFLLVQDMLEKEGVEIAEVFVHPDIIEGTMMDISSSYPKKPYISLKDNINKINKIEKISFKDM